MMPIARGFLSRILISFALISFSSSEKAVYGNNHCTSTRLQAGAGGRSQQELKFTLLSMSNGVSRSGAPFSQNTYGTVRGEKVYELVIHFDSATDAKKELSYWIGKAIKIVDRQQVKEKSGTEERIVITVSGKHCEEATIIMETDKTILHQIQSCSAQAALDFEKEFKGTRGTGDKRDVF